MPRPQRVLLTLSALIVIALIIHVSLGSSATITPLEAFQQILRGPGSTDTSNVIVWEIRLPRAITCLLVGALLGTVGSAFPGAVEKSARRSLHRRRVERSFGWSPRSLWWPGLEKPSAALEGRFRVSSREF